MSKYILGCLGIVLAVLVVPVLLSIQMINPGQAAVSTRFGTLNGVRNEGVYLALFEGYTVYNLKAKQTSGHYDAGSRDGQFIYVDATFTYNLKSDDLPELYSKVGSQQELEDKFIGPTLTDVIKQVTAQYTADEILPKQADFRAAVIKAVVERMNQDYLTIGDLQITNIDFTPEYNTAIEAKQIAFQNAEKAKLEAQAKITSAEADAQVQKLQQQSLTAEVLQRMMIEKWNGVLPTYTGAGSPFLTLQGK